MAMGPPAADLFLGNFDFAVEFPFPITPNVIPVGGVTAEAPNDLPQELEDFIQSSGDDGIVVFTLSTYFASVTTSRPHLLKMFIDALAKLPQKIIIQLKVMPQYDLPPNIKALPWLPLNDLLGHPKTRLFMYHGGNNGFYEAVYHGVPVVVVPFIADQFDTAVKVTSHGMGLQLDKHTLSADYIHKHVAQVLGDEKYSLAAKRLSTILRSRPMEPVDRAAFWIEHVIKHGGDYMRSPGKDLSFIQYNLIDVFTFLIGIGALLLFAFYKIMRCCISCCWRKKNSQKSKSE
ncbi:UDP-glucuronosyltransferase 2B33-like [Strongylocentrotus purpuratus]|uniref:Glucuronosyltransferase n=1 Tax=Strongylocentrotus purpuratus TaxID=7668 RepID=A0A7M7NZY9_STRPU|nr:UDP-glucuronosyltransferase 2B33-like [Strongylocentrotus purpuratus]